MGTRAKIRAVLATFLYTLLSVGALLFADYALLKKGPPALQRLYELARLPEQHLGASWSTPGRIKAALHTSWPRRTPSGHASALWYAWVEDTRKSGKNTYTVLVCARGEDTELELHDGVHVAALDLFAHGERVALLKDEVLETLPLDRVALDLGEVYSSRQIPPVMTRLCGDQLPRHGSLHYYEARVPPGGQVTVLGCGMDGAVQSCGTPPAMLSVRGLGSILRAYANDGLKLVRGAAAAVGIALALLASALFKLREEFSGGAK